jgi:DNA-binding transcriptional ArsR family regulator
MHDDAMESVSAPVRRLMSCLGDPSRFELVRRLARGQLCVSDLAREVGLSQSCTTRHLQALRRERLVVGERDGKRVLFRLSLEEPQAAALLGWVMSGRTGRPTSGRAPARRARSGTPQGPPPSTGDHPTAAHLPGEPPVARTPHAGSSAAPASEGAVEPIAGPPVIDAPDPHPSRPRRADIEDFLL